MGAYALALGHAPRFVESVDRGKRDLVLLRVFTRGLAERFARLLDVQNVVHDLKRQAHVLAVAGQGIELSLVRARVDRSHPHTGPEQSTGLGAVDGFEERRAGRLA